MSALERITDWPGALAAFIDDRMYRPFAWGRNDCVLFAADAVLAITGHDFAAKSNRLYRTAQGAVAVLRRLGVVDVAALAEKALSGPQRVAATRVSFARRGDVGLTELDGRKMLAIAGSGIWMGPGGDGMAFVKPERILRAWAIGWPGR